MKSPRVHLTIYYLHLLRLIKQDKQDRSSSATYSQAESDGDPGWIAFLF